MLYVREERSVLSLIEMPLKLLLQQSVSRLDEGCFNFHDSAIGLHQHAHIQSGLGVCSARHRTKARKGSAKKAIEANGAEPVGRLQWANGEASAPRHEAILCPWAIPPIR